MGTRNLTIVKSNGKVKVAQYGQWDGYPTGQGQTIADLLSKFDLKKFKEKIDKLGVYTQKEKEQAYIDAGADPKDEWISGEISEIKNKNHPALCRDHGAGILELIYDDKVKKVELQEDFEKDGLFCEYCYKIDLNKKTVIINGSKPYTFKQWCRKGLMKKLENKEE
jgi:hypothetical protein